MTDLEAEISAWDQKSVADAESIYQRHRNNDDFVTEIIRLTGFADFERGATWLLKHHIVDNATAIPPEMLPRLCAHLPTLTHWETKLHILQCLSVLPIPLSDAERVNRFLDACLGDDAKFVRAWAFSGLYRLAVQFPEYRAKATSVLQKALVEETSAAVKVRVRKAIAAGF